MRFLRRRRARNRRLGRPAGSRDRQPVRGGQGAEEPPPEQVQRLPEQPLEGALEEEEEKQAAEGRAPEAPPLVAAALQMALSLGTYHDNMHACM